MAIKTSQLTMKIPKRSKTTLAVDCTSECTTRMATKAFVAIRVVHSLVQSTANVVLLRFGIFMVSWLVLIAMMVREALVIF